MTRDRRDTLLDRDWSAAWDRLPEAPPLVPRPRTAQITLRIPTRLLARIKALAAARSLPYHALARAWIIEALRTSASPVTSAMVDEPQAEQLNIKVDNESLDNLKIRADELRRPYHRLAREWIEAALTREEENLGITQSPAGRPAIKDLMIMLLHSPGSHGDDAIRGMTRLQKLLFVVEQKLAAQHSRYYAYNFGPFNEEVNDAAHALRLAGFIRGSEAVKATPPSFAEMMATAAERSGPGEQTERQEFALSDRGHDAAERLRQSSRAYDQLFEYVRQVRQEWDTPRLDQLVDRVYEEWPKFADKSLIRGRVKTRSGRKRRS
jgi:predicted DNA binding CopG/RHH family protein